MGQEKIDAIARFREAQAEEDDLGFEPEEEFTPLIHKPLVHSGTPEERQAAIEGGAMPAGPGRWQDNVRTTPRMDEAGNVQLVSESRTEGPGSLASRVNAATDIEVPTAIRAMAQWLEQRAPGAAGAAGRELARGTVSPEAAAHGAGQAATLGFADELAGAVEAATGGDYTEGRDRVRAMGDRATAAHPASAMAGGIAGGAMVAPVLPSTAGLAPTGTGRAAAIGRTALAGLEGAGYGAIGGAGGSRGETAGEVLEDAGAGAGAGALMGVGLQGGLEAGTAAARRVRDPQTEANVLRYRAMFEGDRPPRRLFREQFGPAGPRRAQRAQEVVDDLRRAGVESAEDAIGVAEQGRDDLHRIATELDEAAARSAGEAESAARQEFGEAPTALGVERRALASRDADRAAARAEDALEGQRIFNEGPPPSGTAAASPRARAPERSEPTGDALDAWDASDASRRASRQASRERAEAQFGDEPTEAFPLVRERAGYRSPPPPNPMGDMPEAIARRLREYAESERIARGVGEDFTSQLEREAQRWEQAAQDGPMTFQRAWDFRKAMSDPAHWTVGPRGTMPVSREAQRDIYQIIREEMERAAQNVDPALAQQWREASQRVHTTLPMAQAADEAQLRGWQNRQVGLTDHIAAAGGGSPLSMAVRALGARMVRRYEHGVAANAYETVHRLAQTNPAALGPFGRTLSAAARRGPGAFAATYYTLWHRDPSFQQQMREVDDPDAQTQNDAGDGSARSMGETLETTP